ncbi:MAG: glycine oxidase ThiO, partial [Rivularia sp. ALOHA_DT_140]|nr:glycine oxidase ThiO [Rivularia sp. ALOHA_DT_140]
IISRDFQAAATHAAAGMLAPDAEQISYPAMQQLCWRTRSLYPEWVSKLEKLTGLNTGYWSCGILAPVYQKPSHPIESKQNSPSPSYWLDKEAIHQYQSGLGEDIVGGWWYPEDGQVDNRALGKALLMAVQSLDIEIKEGIGAEAILQQQCRVVGIQTNAGLLQADHYIIATGAWANELFPLPVQPKKGQMLRVRVAENVSQSPLKRILFGENTYIVPRKDGRIIVGATSEDVGFTPHNTPKGIQSLLASAICLYPQLQDYPIEEFWWGFRPATPDELPIIGKSHCDNLSFATGHYRNGILLAPITAKLIADLICEQISDSLLENFHYSRFQSPSNKNSSISMLAQPANLSLSLSNNTNQISALDTSLVIAGKTFNSRLMTGTGKYRSIEEMQQSVEQSGCQIVT